MKRKNPIYQGLFCHPSFIDLTGQKFTRLTALECFQKNKRVYWVCKCDCGAIKEVAGSKLKNGNTKSCGCLNKELSSKRQVENNTGKNGKKHPMYGKKGKLSPNYGRRKENPLSPINTLVRMSFDYKEWRENVFERDDYTCQKCFSVGGHLNSHHIESFNNNHTLRFCLENGITFCKTCHGNFHKFYGRGNNTRIQLERFLTHKEKT